MEGEEKSVEVRRERVTVGLFTVSFYLPVGAFDDFAELWPFGEVFEVEGDAVGFCQVVEVAGVKV